MLFILIPVSFFADQEQSTFAYVKNAYGGRHFFVMLPHPKKYYSRDTGKGYVKSISRTGKIKTLWKVSGWYAFKTYLSYDGEYLVRMGNWPRGVRPSQKHLAIAFYNKSGLIKRYSTKDLIKTLSKVRRSRGHYRYKKKIIGFTGYNYRFTLITIDNVKYVFDVRNGKIIKSKQM